MANVLPKDILHAVQRSHRARFVLVGSLVAMVCGVVALLALVPSYAVVSAERGTTSDAQVPLSASTDREDVMHAQLLVKELRPVASSTISALDILDEALSIRPKGTIISSMRLSRGSPGSIVMNGIAPSRDAINAYRAILSQDTRFETVSVPIGTLSGAAGGPFSVTITGTF